MNTEFEKLVEKLNTAQQEITDIKRKLAEVETTIRGLAVKETEKEDVDFFPLIRIDKAIFSVYNQNDEPTILANQVAFWIDANGGPAYYLIFNYNGTAKKIALT